MERTILIVNTDGERRNVVQEILEREGYRVLSARTCPTALKTLQEDRVDLVLLDIDLVAEEGFGTWEKLKQVNPYLPVVTVSFNGSYRTW